MAATGRQRGASQSYNERQPTDPRYAEPYDDHPANGMYGAAGVSRSASQRQRPSGSGSYDTPNANYSYSSPPTAPREHNRPSYDGPYALAMPQVSRSSKSFAARAGAIPQQTDITPSRADSYRSTPTSAPQEHMRRGSEGHPQQLDYARVRQAPPAQYATYVESTPVREVSVRSSERPRERRNPRYDDVDSAERARAAPPMRSATMGSIATAPADWAADRSPLQKLEVKLNDISKEEKRARVQEAEQRLRELKSRETSRLVPLGDPTPQRTTSRRIASDSARPSQPRTRAPESSRADEPVRRDSLARRNLSNPAEVSREQSQKTFGALGPGVAAGQSARRTSLTSRGADPTQRRRSSDGGRGDERAVRFQSDDGVESLAPAPPRDERQPLPLPRGGSLKNNAAQRPGGMKAEDKNKAPAPPAVYPPTKRDPQYEAQHSRTQHLKHQLPPRTAAGAQTRRQIGFERSLTMDDQTESGGHKISNLIHRHKQQPGVAVDQAPYRRLEEWRTAETAHLTLEDALATPDPSTAPAKGGPNVAWWEESPAQRKRRSATTAEVTAFDGAQEDSNGTVHPFPLSHRRSSLATPRDTDGPVRARQYIGYSGTLKPERRNRSWHRSPRSIIKLRFGHQMPRNLSFSYSYEFAELSKLDYYSRRGYCGRYHVDKSLTKAMRAIRVRAPIEPTQFTPPIYLKCGPLLRYTGMRRDASTPGKPAIEVWRGSVMIVTTDDQSEYDPAPTLRVFHQPMDLLPPPPTHFDESQEEDLPYEYIDPVGGLPKMNRRGATVYVKPAEDLDPGKDVSMIEDDDGLYEFTRTANVPTQYGKANELLGRSPLPSLTSPRLRKPTKSGRFREIKGVRLHAEHGVTFWRFNLEVELGKEQSRIAYRINKGASIGFWVPARDESMNVMFHSCNGFSRGVDPNTFSGPDPLWRDVLNTHQTKPFHVMIGGGDQIYNDVVMEQTRLFQEWIDIKNPHEKHKAEFTIEMQEELETFYLERYSMWFSQGLFGMANSQIPMINIWDDHDIIDGYGSYPDSFMSTPVFCGLGNIAFKYYMLFQHQSVADELEEDEPSWLLGSAPGPYISSVSRSVFVSLGQRMAFLGIDCRTERTRDEVVSENSYNLILDRCRQEIRRGTTRHLLVLLGVPIAYPRLVWLENVLTSRALDPLKALGRMGLLGGFMNKFDGGVEIVDDLDDHWTARNHKEERNWFIEELQALAAEKSVRITLLSGDVHLAAVGQFYSNKALKISKDHDHRYMPNIISSAIVNTPPPDMMADILNKRNKVHHLNTDTDEDMIPMFTHDVDGKPRNNKHLLPKRNWCSITEYLPGSTPPPTPPSTITPTESHESLPPKPPSALQRTLSLGGKDSKPAKLIRRLSLTQKPASYVDQSPSPPPERSQPRARQARDYDDDGDEDDDDQDDPPQSRVASVPIPTRPIHQFHRAPTNLSEKAALKGGAEEGHVDLEYGLDIKLNCEIKQGDPSGVTEGYRLLVPALRYEDAFAAFNERKPSIIRRLSNAGRTLTGPRYIHGNGSMQPQRASEDGGSSQAVNDTGSDPGAGPPRRPPFEVPARGPSLLKKRPIPFMPRPRQDVEISAPMPMQPAYAPAPQPQTRGPPPPGLGLRMSGNDASLQAGRAAVSRAGKYNISAPLEAPPRRAAYEEDDDDDDELDDELLEEQPRRAHRGKFDGGGASKFFGGAVPGQPQAGGPPGSAGSQGVPGMMGSREAMQMAPDGLPEDVATSWASAEADGKKKGWRRFFKDPRAPS